MSWLSKIFKDEGKSLSSAGDVIRFYQHLGFFPGADPAAVIRQYTDDHGDRPHASNPWDDVFLLAYSKGEAWADDPEADVCAENLVYSEVLPQWARISQGAFAPSSINEHWDSDTGPIAVRFLLGELEAELAPNYQDDWIDLEVLRQINQVIAASGRQFECAVDGNFALVVCVTSEQKATMQSQRNFPFAW